MKHRQLIFSLLIALAPPSLSAGAAPRPNILFCLSDDQSWPHASAYGEPVIETPVFDRIAREGALFKHAYCAAPSCTPSRSAILTGQDIWRLGEGGQLFGTLPAEHPVYTDLLMEHGYHVDYFLEIQRFDREIGGMLDLIERAGQLGNTLVVITSDNGMPFPRAKANLYDSGTRMPLAIRWPKDMKGNRKIDDFVNLTDLAPTFLEAAGVAVPEVMTGRSLLGILRSEKSGTVDPQRDAVFTARERHAWCRIDGVGYPARMMRTRDHLYIRNYEPDRKPAGTHRIVTNEGPYGDIDNSPTKRFMLEHRDEYPELYQRAFGKRPKEELYDCRTDPFQMHNLASDPEHSGVLKNMSDALTAHLKATGDPRETTGETPWDDWKYHGRNNWKVEPE